MKKEKTNEFNSIEEDINDLASKEEEIVNSYFGKPEEEIIEEVFEDEIDDDSSDEEVEEVYEEDVNETSEKTNEDDNDSTVYTSLDEDDYYDEDYSKPDKTYRISKLIINIVFTIIVIMFVMIVTDVVCVTKFQKGPYFSLPVKTYDDGGTKEYYGIGYKVIKYNQIQGRRDLEIGSWSLKYNIDPITSEAVDMSIEFYDNPTEAYKKYQKKFVRIISTLQKVDKKNHKIEIGYNDDGGKYTLDITCNVVDEQKDFNKLEEGKEITIIGSVSDFKIADKKNPNRLYINNCFAEQ